MNGSGKSAIDLCEEAVHLLRRAPLTAISIYYLGSLPFVLGFLFFWTDMSESAVARERAAPEALGMALLYLWMITCQAQFARQLRAGLAMEPVPARSLRTWLALAASQSAVQPTKLIVLPVAALVGLPLAAAVAFYHNASTVEPLTAARRQASLWPKQNWMFQGILAMLAIVVFVNVALTLFALPYLAKMFLGIDTVFTRSVYGVLNTTFVAVACGVSYLILNPLVRAFYVLRCFYGESLTTAQDLRAQLKMTAAVVAAVVCLTCCIVPARAAPPPTPEAEALNQSIEQVLRRPEYSWRLPRAPQAEEKNENWIVRSTVSFLNYTERELKRLGNWIDRLADKLGDLLGKRTLPPVTASTGPPPARSLRMWIVMLLAIVAGIAVYFGWQMLAKRSKIETATDMMAPVAIDLASANLQADEQPLEQWLQMARNCVERRELRLAMRALYLAGLAALAAERLIALKSSKSDRDYARELQRRARNRPELVSAFGNTLNIFERVWYGLYEVDLDLIQKVQANVEQMRTSAQ